MINNPLWEYSLAIYQREGVEALLLTLQDRFSVDINLILAACWLATQQRSLSVEAASQAIVSTQAWRQYCVQPLRAVRRYLKAEPHHCDMREQVKTLELEAERIQQNALFDQLGDAPRAPASSTFGELGLRNLRAYCEASRDLSWREIAVTASELINRLG